MLVLEHIHTGCRYEIRLGWELTPMVLGMQEASLIDPFSGFARDFLRPVMVSCKCSGSHVQVR